MADPIRALRDTVRALAAADGVHAHLCEGDPSAAVVWSEQAQITVRLRALGDDELWVLAGEGLLARVIADSEGDFEIEWLVRAILAGNAVEIIGPSPESGAVGPLGWMVPAPTGGHHAGSEEPGPGLTVSGITGPFGRWMGLPRGHQS